MRYSIRAYQISILTLVLGLGRIVEGLECSLSTFSNVPAPEPQTTITIDSVTPVGASPFNVAFCRVKAHIITSVAAMVGPNDKEIQIEVRLPDVWNQKYMQYGGAGFDGGILFTSVPGSAFGPTLPSGTTLSRGYTIAASDSGHVGNPYDASWIRNPDGTINTDRLRNYSYRYQHLLAVSAKNIMNSYYGSFPIFSYAGGYSNGGRAGLILAQRYPNDFDGIFIHSPVTNAMNFAVSDAIRMQLQYPVDLLHPVVQTNQLSLIASITLNKCDAVDGISDGIIWDPLNCNFDVSQDLPLCANDVPLSTCFTAAQLGVLKTFYSPSVATGHGKIYPRFLPGYEDEPARELIARFISPPGTPPTQYIISEQAMKYVCYNDPIVTMQTLDMNQMPTDCLSNPPSGIDYNDINATNPDLRAFKQRGGKIIITAGLEDPLVSPLEVRDYYKNVVATMGGLRRTTDFARLFLIPGTGHTPGHVAAGVPSNVDWIGTIEQWVEQGVAPEFMLGSNTGITRPICHYPLQAVLIDPSGATTDASNFTCSSKSDRKDE